MQWALGDVTETSFMYYFFPDGWDKRQRQGDSGSGEGPWCAGRPYTETAPSERSFGWAACPSEGGRAIPQQP